MSEPIQYRITYSKDFLPDEPILADPEEAYKFSYYVDEENFTKINNQPKIILYDKSYCREVIVKAIEISLVKFSLLESLFPYKNITITTNTEISTKLLDWLVNFITYSTVPSYRDKLPKINLFNQPNTSFNLLSISFNHNKSNIPLMSFILFFAKYSYIFSDINDITTENIIKAILEKGINNDVCYYIYTAYAVYLGLTKINVFSLVVGQDNSVNGISSFVKEYLVLMDLERFKKFVKEYSIPVRMLTTLHRFLIEEDYAEYLFGNY